MEKKGGTRSKNKKNTKPRKTKGMTFKHQKNMTLNPSNLKNIVKNAKFLKGASIILILDNFERIFNSIIEINEGLFEKGRKTGNYSIIRDEMVKLNKIIDNSSKILDTDILNTIKDKSIEVYNILKKDSAMNENTSNENDQLDIIVLYAKILKDLRTTRENLSVDDALAYKILNIQKMIAEDLIHNIKPLKKRIKANESNDPDINALTNMFKRKTTMNKKSSLNVDDLTEALNRLGV